MLNKLKVALAATAAAGALALAGTGTAQASIDIGSQANPLNQTGTMSFSATAPSSRLVVNGLALNCAVTSGSGVATTRSNAGIPATVATIQPVFGSVATPCIGPSNFQFTVACVATSDLTVTNDIPVTVGPPAVWTGTVTGIDCTVTFPLLGCSARVTGSVPGTYTNPTATVGGKITVNPVGQSLTVSGTTCPSDILPNGSASFGGTGVGATGLSSLTYTLSGASTAHPFITRT